jgi:hypothetical protein
MKKVLGTMSKFVGGIFSLAVLALLMSLTYGALQRIFPSSFSNQMWGLVMFDIAAMCWALIFVFQSHSVGQYAAAGIGFIVGFVGTLGMVAAEVILSGQNLAHFDTSQIGRWMVYGFIIVTAIHAALVYAHHATSPEISEQINVGVARGEVVSQAISDATKTIEAEKHDLSRAIYYDIVSQVKRDLGLHPVDNTVFDRRQNRQFNLETEDMPLEEWEQLEADLREKGYLKSSNLSQPAQSPSDLTAQAHALGMWNSNDPNDSPFWNSRPDVHDALTKAPKEAAKPALDRPLSLRFRDWVNSLRQPPAMPQASPATVPQEPQPQPSPTPTPERKQDEPSQPQPSE